MSFLRLSFIPVYVSSPVAELGESSMLIGGATMYLKPDEPWPTCATCAHPLVPLLQLNASSEATPSSFRTLIPSPTPAKGARMLATMVQLFVCPEGDCYDTSTGYSTNTRSWVVRIATVPVSPSADTPYWAEARAKIEEGNGFLPARVVEGWAIGKKETLDQELLWGQDDSEEFYAAHEPEPGLKLLGHTVRGKYFCSDRECPRAGTHEHPSRRELIQLGDLHCDWEEDEALGMMATLGNAWIEQCVDHPEVLTLSMSGNW
ncbi:hypothetical protein MVEN_02145700 [Mycena venus]|uniref:Uncharacterized protein n=1 Tax=Mycena venus TaxID=2733690 RepID=A0A8H6XAR8_9AGAR|nr:hypothetical protein MVEN_02145700 [Mycena venus]